MIGDQSADGQRSLFILSPGDRDGLSEVAQRAGWRPISARRAKDAPQRYLRSEAQVALVDLRNGGSAAELLAPLVPAMEAGGGALLVLLDGADEVHVPAIMAAGATHYLVGPPSDAALRGALASAHRLVERIGGGVQDSRRAQRIRRGDALYWEWSRKTGLLTLSDNLVRQLGLPEARMEPATLLRQLPRNERRGVLASLRTMRRAGRPGPLAHALPDKPGLRLVHHLRLVDGGVAADVEWLSEGAEGDAASRDYLTGLHSRHAALDWLDRRRGLATTVLLLSISQFDRMNAAYGQVVGDALLGRIARRVERMVDDVAPGSMVARIAGTEFLVGLIGEAAGSDRATFLARQLIGSIGRPFSAGDHLIRLTTRCGIAQSRIEDDATKLLRRAGTALADARQAGGEGIRILSAERQSRQVDGDRLETDLRLALDRGEIGIVFQPQYDVADDAVVGVEALARWDHPDHGPLGAAVLFATAERSDFLLPLSRHIHAEALRLAASWPAALSDLRLSINVTSADIAQPEFVGDFLGLIAASGFPRDRVTVEITESGLIDDLTAAAGLMDQLRVAGLRIAIDDFGTGYSSLAYLKALPLDYLKIDSGLAQDIAGSPRDRVVVQSVIQMARSLGLRVIAEGVETEQQRALLAHEGCHYYQGFLRAPPLSSDALVERLTSAGSR